MAQNEARLPTILDYDDQVTLKRALEGCVSCSELDWKVANLEQKNSQEESLDAEIRRLQVLRSYRILDTGRKASFERLTALAARIFDVPICLVSLVDLGRQWFASNRGLGDVRETPRSLAFCAHAILSKLDLFIVPDTWEDARFRDHGLVTGDPKIRFYAGAPLVTPEGYKLGTFCIIDRKPRPNGLSLEEKQNLRELAALAMDQIQESKVDVEKSMKDHSRQIACTAHDLITPLTSIQLNVGLLSEDEELLKVLSKNQREIISNTKECVDIMSSICQHSIQEFRGKQPHKMDLDNHEVGTVNIPKLLKSLEHVMSTYPKSVPLEMRMDDDVPPIIKGDVLSAFRSSLNFLTNSCKVTKVGSIEFHLSIRYATGDGSDSRNSLLFRCVDTGPGIDKKQIHDLFSPDGGLRMSQESEYGGVGLGLHSVSELISGCGGEYGYQPR
jgi:signal transduction histidine kinase